MRFSDRKDEQDDIEINMAPVIDVVFLLLIFFAVATTFSMESEIRIRLPESSDQSIQERQDPVLVVEISAKGDYAVRGPDDDAAKPLLNSDRATLYRALATASGDRADLVTVIRADRRSPYESVIRAMDIVRLLGHADITFATQQLSEPDGLH